MLSKNLAGSLHKEKRDILIMSYLSSLEFEGLLFEVTSYWLPWCKFSGLLPEQKRYENGGGGYGAGGNTKKPNGHGLDREDTVSAMLAPLNFVQGEERIIEWRVSRTLPSGENGNMWETRENVLKNKLLRSTSPIAIIRQTHLILQSVSFRAHIHIIGKNTQGPKTKFCLKCRHQTRRHTADRLKGPLNNSLEGCT